MVAARVTVNNEAEQLILEILALAPSSFAALYGTIVRTVSGSAPSVMEFVSLVDDFARLKWIRLEEWTGDSYRPVAALTGHAANQKYRQWLETSGADLSVGALSCDEVGIWLELLPAGRSELEGRAKTEPSACRWVLDYDATTESLTIHAHDEAAAQEALGEFLATSPTLKAVPETLALNSVSSYRLRSSETVTAGVQLRVRVTHRKT